MLLRQIQRGRLWTCSPDVPMKGWSQSAALNISRSPMHYDDFDFSAGNSKRLDAESRIVNTNHFLGEGNTGDEKGN